MRILAHRGNRNGIIKAEENKLPALKACLARGWGVETDIRRSPQAKFYISHDPADVTVENAAEKFFKLFRMYPQSPIALNFKELGYEAELIRYLQDQSAPDQLFLFDMELIEETSGQTAKKFRQLDPNIRLAARVSDRDETIERALNIECASVIWLDEFDGLWVTQACVQRLKQQARTIYAISPEIHGFSRADMLKRWEQFHQWGVDGICTDYAEELDQHMNSLSTERSA